jgi:hypothetical protein
MAIAIATPEPGDGRTFRIPPYAPESLEAYVDGVVQPAEEVNPTDGTFSLAFAPTGSERVTADYQPAD